MRIGTIIKLERFVCMKLDWTKEALKSVVIIVTLNLEKQIF